MQLDPDCIRDILLVIEAESDGREPIYFSDDGSGECWKSIYEKYGYGKFYYHLNAMRREWFVKRIGRLF